MLIEYKGFKLKAEREKCMAGYNMVYYSAYRISDGWELCCRFSDSADTVREFIKDLKSIVDDYLENPQEYEN